MKTIIFSIAIASLFVLVSIFTGFPIPLHKNETANNKLQEAKIGFNLKQTTENEVVVNKDKLEAAKTEIWECETAIINNENIINEINAKIKNDGSTLDELYAKRINAKEMRNYQLQKRIVTIEKKQSKWEQLKRKLGKDLDKFGGKIYLLVFEKRN